MPDDPALTDGEIERATDKSMAYAEKFFVSSDVRDATDAQLRKALWWAANKIRIAFDDGSYVGWYYSHFSADLRDAGIEPWSEEGQDDPR